MMKVSETLSISEPNSVMATGVSSSVNTPWGLATGGSLTATTLILTSASSESSPDALTLNLKESGPLEFKNGV